MKINTLICVYCKKEYIPTSSQKCERKKHGFKKRFCSFKCYSDYRQQFRITLACSWCGKTFSKIAFEMKKSKSGRHYCSQSCSQTFNNQLRRNGRRSKCEILLFEMLNDKYGKATQIIANDKTMLDGLEMDIAFPDIKLGIEWNGIVHFKPIYGQTKLTKVQEIDARKQKIAQDKNINLIVIPDLVSKKTEVEKAFKQIVPIIDNLLL